MKNSIDLKQCLLVYNKVTSQGALLDGKYQLSGVKAWSDFDGYHCFLEYRDVVMTLMFHGKYDIQFSDPEAVKRFEKKLNSFV